ncbi:hypothetical protein CCUS01_09043 [Colletotrichum cuscutae]|uniref:Secreted protein n=1 Tax=Colletotrichum cuscutae TaxID=1209917 RepID=A0AAI9ULH4_9PEZI|nr:hypothetical protein CCUS01_09043 [Colletotrichum cuscutae]
MYIFNSSFCFVALVDGEASCCVVPKGMASFFLGGRGRWKWGARLVVKCSNVHHRCGSMPGKAASAADCLVTQDRG